MVKRRGRRLSWHHPLLATTPHQREGVSALDSGEDGKSRKSDVLSCLSSQLAVRKTTNQQRVTSMSELDRLHRSQVYPPARGLYSLRVIAFISSQK
ncbi:hypothetical protein TNCV_1937471 [Trichonephila clavipes]|nr:hypothetical protein TNCV_1937471 [Trichonephila clavipes]